MGSGASTSVASKKVRKNVLLQCRERKRLLKTALDRRRAFSYAHCKYILSMYRVGKAIRSFVAGISAPPSPCLLTNNPSTSESNDNVNPPPPQQTPPEPEPENHSCQPSTSTSSSRKKKKKRKGKKSGEEDEKQDDVLVEEEFRVEGECEEKQQDDNVVCEHFHDGVTVTPPEPSVQAEAQSGWDFFSPHEKPKTQTWYGYGGNFDNNLVHMIRDEERIPELEEEKLIMGEFNFNVQYACVRGQNGGVSEVIIEENSNEIVEETKHMKVTHTHKSKCGVSGAEALNDGNLKVTDNENGFASASAHEGEPPVTVMDDAPTNGRELLEVLEEIEGCFVKAYESGLEVSRMLEAKSVQLQTGLEGRKGSSSNRKIFRSTMKGPLSSQASCFSIFLSRSSSTWMEFNSDMDYDTMEFGSLSETLCRLYAWERKLYDDVKAGEDTKKLFDRKCIQLWKKDAKADSFYAGKTRADVISLRASKSVSIQRAQSTSEKIVKIRDEELHPQLVELRQGLMTTWKNMLELHGKQRQAMIEVAEFSCPTYGKFCGKYHRLATVELAAALQNWRACFSKYVSTQKAYLEVLNGWISMCIIPEMEEKNSGNKNNALVTNPRAIPLVAVCQDWLAALNKLPNKAVTCAMKDFGKHIRKVHAQQGKEIEQKRKVDQLTKEYDRKVKALKKAEKKIYKKKSGLEWDGDAQERLESLVGMKDSLDMFKNMLDEERAKHVSGTAETKSITLKGFQEGFSSVFESMIGFSKASVDMYAGIGTNKEGGTNEDNGNYNPSLGQEMDS